MNDEAPQTPKHPGEHLRRILAERDMLQNDLAFILGKQPQAVNLITALKGGISADMSKALGNALGFPPNYFADLQTAYDLACANDPDPSIIVRADILKQYPVREMIKRGWIKDSPATDLRDQLARFLEQDSSDGIPYLAHAAKKTSYEDRDIRPEQLIWLYRVRQIAKSIACPEYSPRGLTTALDKMHNMLLAPEEARHVPRVLMEAGVRFIMVEALPQGKIDGVCFWLDDKSPVIGISSRYDRIDNFWFVVRHECEHVLRKHGQGYEIVDDLENTNQAITEEERIANAAAADFCVPAAKLESFINRKHPFYYEKDVLAFAKLHGIHPGIVVGQIQNKLNRYDYLKKYQVKVRQFVLPSAITDGWGQAHPV